MDGVDKKIRDTLRGHSGTIGVELAKVVEQIDMTYPGREATLKLVVGFAVQCSRICYEEGLRESIAVVEQARDTLIGVGEF